VRWRDGVALVCAALALVLSSLHTSGSSTLELAYVVPLDRHPPPALGDDWAEPPPLITDTDGDGHEELVLLQGEGLRQLAVVPLPSAEERAARSDQLLPPQLAPDATVDLFSGLRFTGGRRPAALAAGFLDPWQQGDPPRRRAIVVLREDWAVLCYGSDLSLRWDSAVHHFRDLLGADMHLYEPADTAVLLTSRGLGGDGTSGMVVVGGRMRRRKQFPAPLDDSTAAAAGHFSLFAFDGATGDLLWTHDGSKKEKAKAQDEPITFLNLHDHRLDPAELTRDQDGEDWTMFRSSVLGCLPHGWTGPTDTHLQLAHFQREHAGGRAASARHARLRQSFGTDGASAGAGGAGGRGQHHRGTNHVLEGRRKHRPAAHSHPSTRLPGLSATVPVPLMSTSPHDDSEHLHHANAVVAHTASGLEVVALRDGRPVTSLALPHPPHGHGLYADVNGDKVVDLLTAVERRGHPSSGMTSQRHYKGLGPCSAVALSGLPPREQLFNGSLCDDRGSFAEAFSDPTSLDSRASRAHRLYEVGVARPVLLHRHDIFGRLAAQQAAADGSPVSLDVIYAVGSGVVSSYSSEGDLRWQSRGGPQWSTNGQGFLVKLPATGARPAEHVLVVGESNVAIFSADGRILADVALPEKVLRPPVVGDFNADGDVDILLVGDSALWGYSAVSIPGGAGMLRLLVLMLTVTMVVAFFANASVGTRLQRQETATSSSRLGRGQPFTSISGGMARKRLSAKGGRSTD